MKNLAHFTLSGRTPAFIVVSGFLLMALVFPLSALLSAAAIVLITLHAGPKNALVIAAAAAAALALCMFFISQHALLGAVTALAQLMPSLILASIFYRTRSLSLSLQMAAVLGAAGFILIVLWFPEHAQFWQKTLTPMLTPALEARGYGNQESSQMLAQTAQFMTGLLLASIVLVHSSILLLGYWLYGQINNRIQFSHDLHHMRLGKVLAISCVMLGMIAITSGSAFVSQLCAILVILFFLQGMIVTHAICSRMTKGRLWLIIAYCLVIFVPQTIFVVILLGLSETFFKLRERAL